MEPITILSILAGTYLAIKAEKKINHVIQNSSSTDSEKGKFDKGYLLINYGTRGYIDFRDDIELCPGVYWTGGPSGFKEYHSNVGRFNNSIDFIDCFSKENFDVCYIIKDEYIKISEPVYFEKPTCKAKNCTITFSTENLVSKLSFLPPKAPPVADFTLSGYQFHNHTYTLRITEHTSKTAWFRYFVQNLEGVYATFDLVSNKTIMSQKFHSKFPARLYYGEIDGYYGLL